MSHGFLAAPKDAPLDPITGLDQLFRDDPSPAKINLVVGVWQNDNGESPVLNTVKKAEERLLRTETSKSYLPMAGESRFLEAVHDLVFREGGASALSGHAASLQAPGGTGALRLAAEFIFDHRPEATVWITSPAYPNHKGIFESVGLRTDSYRYYDVTSGTLTLHEGLGDLERARPGDVVILHGCCHNPSGADLTVEQWRSLAALLAARNLLPLIDLAYLGFARSLAEDSAGARIVLAACGEGIVTTSFSKNFALYGERVGVVTFVSETPAAARACVERTKTYARRIYSSPPAHGSRIVMEILTDLELRQAWAHEVTGMRQRLKAARLLFSNCLAAHQVDRRVAPSLIENVGMFALTRLTAAHVTRLKDRYHVYMLPNGRLSVEGIRTATMEHLCSSIADVLKHEPLSDV
jgi:aromatic-amino-acid transaminase